MDVQLYLKRTDSDKETVVFARISYNGYQLKYYLPEKIHPKNWNKDTKRARETKKFQEYPEFNTRLTNIISDIKTIFRRYQNDNDGKIPMPDLYKELLDTVLKAKPVKPEHTFFTYLQEIIDQSAKGLRVNPKTGKAITKGTPKVYTTVQNHLLEFNKTSKINIDFETIDLEFYKEYTDYLINTAKLSANTIGKHIQTVKLIMNEETEAGFNKNMAYKSKKFIVLREEAENIYLNEAELKEIEKLDLSANPRLDKVRDLFLVGCYTGLRFSDFSILKSKQIKDGFIETTQIKTGGAVVIPVHDVVKNILLKYNDAMPPAISNQKFNSYIKDVVKVIDALKVGVDITATKGGKRSTVNSPKWQLVSTHTARRSFATNEFLAGTPSLTIMAITGHKTEKAFLKYIKVTPNEHAKLMKENWEKRKAATIKEDKKKAIKPKKTKKTYDSRK